MNAELLTLRLQTGEAAFYLGLSTPHVSRLVALGVLKSYRRNGCSEFDIIDLNAYAHQRASATGKRRGRPSTREAFEKRLRLARRSK